MSEPVVIPVERFNQAYVENRVQLCPEKLRGALRSALSYLYLIDGPINLPRNRLKSAEANLEPGELLLIRWLYTRTNGSLRSTYGSKALRAARAARYRCSECSLADVRVLQLDHVDGHTPDTEFACLCANCHSIKSRDNDWSGKKR